MRANDRKLRRKWILLTVGVMLMSSSAFGQSLARSNARRQEIDARSMRALPIEPPASEPTKVPNLPEEPSEKPATDVAYSPFPQPPDARDERPTYRLDDLLALAHRNNPTLVQAQARVNISRGRAWQAGIWPNPFIGYQGEHLGPPGPPPTNPLGEHQAMQVQQEFITARKRQLSRTKYSYESEAGWWFAVAQRMRVVNSVRIQFYGTLADQQLVDDAQTLVKVADAAMRTTEELVNDGQANAPDLLAAQIQLSRSRVGLTAAQNAYRQSWTSLMSNVGIPPILPAKVEGDLYFKAPELDWDATLSRIWDDSPELRGAQAEVQRNLAMLQRERVEPIPNIYATVDPGYNFEQQAFSVSYLVGGYMPIWNKNQGTIFQARAWVAQARANVRRLELELQEELGHEFAAYNTAKANVEAYRNAILPKAKEAYDLLEESFRQRRAAWPQVLVAQREYTELAINYVHALDDLRRAQVEIEGFLLVGGLRAPHSVEPLGQINATHQPR